MIKMHIATLAVSAVSVILLTVNGTYAWRSFNRVTDNFSGQADLSGDDVDTPQTLLGGGVTLHNDSDNPNKDVYVENWGDEPVYARVRLTEYMELGKGAGKYIINGGNDRLRGPSEENKAISLVDGAKIHDIDSWTPHVPSEADAAEAASGAALYVYWSWDMGGQKHYMPEPESERDKTADDPTVYSANDPGVLQTLDAIVLTMRQWKDIGCPIGECWVIDTDGWAYWAAPLQPRTATGLLLSAVSRTDVRIEDEYYYGIDIWAQTATKDGDLNYNDFGMLENGGWTDDGHALMDALTSLETAEVPNGGGVIIDDDSGVIADDDSGDRGGAMDAEDGVLHGETGAGAASVSAAYYKKPAYKKAIYVLPGFMESRLFSSKFFGLEIWTGLGYVTDIGADMLGFMSEMAQYSNSTGMRAYSDRSRDKYGTASFLLPMINGINSALKSNGLENTYKVEFFPYNWLSDLNAVSNQLAADIKAKGYEDIILISHSNGGLLASAFISQSDENKQKVEKAIFLASPLWGTYTALEPLESGSVTIYDGALDMGLIQIGYSLLIKPITKHWVYSWAKNAPNVYQLLANESYLSRIPIRYKTASGVRFISSPEDYYSLLKKSSRINPALVDSSNKSMKYLYQDVFKGDPLDQWEGIDATFIGCEYGFLTPFTAAYHQSGGKSIYDGPIYSKAGDGFIMDFSMNGNGRFAHINVPGANHIPIVYDSRVIKFCNDIILHEPDARSAELSYVAPMSVNNSSDSMSSMLRMELKSPDPLAAAETSADAGIKIKVYDESGNLAAESDGEIQKGFIENNFIYNSWSTDENETNILCYIPASGYKLEVLTGRNNPSDSDVTISVETLDDSGALTSLTSYKAAGADTATGHIFTLDRTQAGTAAMLAAEAAGVGRVVSPAHNGTKITQLSSEIFNTDWRFASDKMTLVQNAAASPEIIGPDAETVTSDAYIWTTSDASVVNVDENGLVTGVGIGSAFITAAAKDSSYKMESFEATVSN
ncbi:MAG: Ig-like domain-containing protein [Clostridiales bacterium]|jgi:pimeloyl-ACP methyl ester carboxylesterase|nr:Ig-like domain-containing protein [Clostridiales bacterium]